MKVAVIGAGGFIGARLAGQLAATGVEVLAISSSAGRSFDAESGRLSDSLPDDAGVESVVYLAQSPRYRDLPRSAAHVWSVNVTSAVTAAEWAMRCGAKRFVYASSGSVYRHSFQAHREDEPLRRDAWYALSKVQAEEALSLCRPRLSVSIVRLFGVYGPQQSGKLMPELTAAIRDGRDVRLQPHPQQERDANGLRLSLIYVDDAVRILARLASAGGPDLLNVAAPGVHDVREVAEGIGRRLGIAPRFVADDTPRQGDVIADTSLLMQWAAERFWDLESGLNATIRPVGA
jgi:UDP-glucose 4-epimerase